MAQDCLLCLCVRVRVGLKMTLKCHINPCALNIDTDNTIIIDLCLSFNEMRHYAIYNQNMYTNTLCTFNSHVHKITCSK